MSQVSVKCYLAFSHSVHGILQIRILEWVAYPFSSGSSHPRNHTRVSCIASRFFTNSAIREALILFTTLQKSVPFFQMRKLLLREVNSLTPGHTAQPVVKPGGSSCPRGLATRRSVD